MFIPNISFLIWCSWGSPKALLENLVIRSTGSLAMEVFVARQPIFDKKLEVWAYELLFRSGLDNFYENLDGDQASSRVISNSFLLIGMDELTEGKMAFINFTRNLLVGEFISALPKELVAVEILENVEPDEEVIAACKSLKQLGYLLVLDDFVFEDKFQPLIELADIIKVELINLEVEEIKSLVQEFISRGVKFLAEKVETREEFDRALEMGYSYFQGYFFSKPVIVSGQDIPSSKLNYLQILQEIHRPELEFDHLDDIVKREVSLSYKLLKLTNSAAFGFRNKVNSIRHALIILGKDEIKKWVSIIALSAMGDDKPAELVMNSLIRARFCELMAPGLRMKEQSSDLFLMGMFSLIDALVDRPISEILEELPISEDIKVALLGGENRFGDVYESVLAYERGDWDRFSECATKLKSDETEAPELYLESVDWAKQVFQQ